MRVYPLAVSIALLAVTTSACGSADDAGGEPQRVSITTGLDTETVSTDTALGWPERFCNLREGMTREEVRAIMGEPTADYLDDSSQDQYQAYQFRMTVFYAAPRAQDPDPMKVRAESLQPEVTGSLTELTPADLDLFPCASEVFDVDTLAAIYANDPSTVQPASPEFVADVRAAADAVDSQLGEGQEFFEVTATREVTNVFVAVDNGTAAVPYVYRDGGLEPAEPKLTGASGFTFTADAIAFDEDAILTMVLDDLPGVTVDSLSIEGGAGGALRYIVSVRSREGGLLDVTVAPDGEILAVDPV